jgi:HK97 family phage major capsid protein
VSEKTIDGEAFLKEQLTAIDTRIADLCRAAEGAKSEQADELRKLADEFSSHKDETEKALAKVETDRSHFQGVEYDADGDKEKRAFSLWRTIQLVADSKAPRSQGLARKAEYGYEVEVMRLAANTAADDEGGHFVPTTVVLDSIIPELEANTILSALGSPSITGLTGPIQWLYAKGGTTAYYIDTEAEEQITQSQAEWGAIQARRRTLSALSKFTWGALRETAISMEAVTRADFAMKFALREELSAFLGIGAASEPKGLFSYASGTGDREVQEVDWNGVTYGGATQDVSDTARLHSLRFRTANNQAAGARLGFAMEPDAAHKIANVKDADGHDIYIGANSADLSSFMGVPVHQSTQLTNSADTTDMRLVYGDWRQLLRLRFGNMEIRAGEEGEDFSRARISVRGLMDHDCIVLQPKAFVKATNLDLAG